MPDPRAIVALVIILFIVFSPDFQAPVVQSEQRQFDAILEQEEHSWNVLSTSHHGDFNPPENRWLNISGFTNDTGYGWDVFNKVKERAKKLSKHALGDHDENILDGVDNEVDIPVYRNVTGILHGSWVRSPLSSGLPIPQLNMSDYATEGPFGRIPLTSFERNLTGTGGSIRVKLGEVDIDDTLGTRVGRQGQTIESTRSVSATIGIESEDGDGTSWETRALGVHFLESGSLILVTTSSKSVRSSSKVSRILATDLVADSLAYLLCHIWPLPSTNTNRLKRFSIEPP